MLILALILSSCATEGTELSEDERARERENLISAMKSALITSEQELFEEDSYITFPASYAQYSDILIQFRRIEALYDEEIRKLEKGALREVVDYLYTYLDGLPLARPEDFLDSLSSVTPYLESLTSAEVQRIIAAYIEANRSDMDEVYARLAREASIWKNNKENLAAVGIEYFIEEIRPLSAEEIAAAAANAFFESLSANEVTARAALMGGRNG